MTNPNHPWHNVSYGDQAPDIVTALIEIPKGSKAKYEVDKVSGLLKLDRVLFSSVFYPANYGFIPQTLGDDHDPLDILVLSQIEIVPLCLVKSRVIGVMRMIDNDEGDDKIIAVAENDMSVNHIKDISELPAHFIQELQNFFENYTKLEKKKVRIDGFQSIDKAKEIIVRAIAFYKEKFPK
ncbi:MAG TPA: inorganic diphosphatase [Bacteroidia bacterium]|jgi:inorganic pyrophosphatase|nr:inorganic diphosphatase [Bacteroidota bacterium]MBP9790650.1 inorganic diphosphatase [Bacteroidia bacterium]MBK7571115.1 inorganic diphosphatase [Bacteroidota bacterium]MBP9924194.1 inorganic diphosphatase [Bacteroidia bacterium]HQV98969.1 inorganic diphosphatase [Bacteroidia bacterium]